MYSLGLLIIYFYIYSFLGWVSEMFVFKFTENRFRNGGFLNAPILPVYGVGAVTILATVGPYAQNPFYVFTLSVIIASFIEYIAHLLLDKMLNVQLWDYSNIKFNLEGRICLKNCLGFGILALLIIYVVQPIIGPYVTSMPSEVISWTGVILIFASIVDFLATIHTLFTMGANTKNQKESLVDIHNSLGPKLKEFSQIHDDAHKKASLAKRTVSRVNHINLKRLASAFPHGYVLSRQYAKDKKDDTQDR